MNSNEYTLNRTEKKQINDLFKETICCAFFEDFNLPETFDGQVLDHDNESEENEDLLERAGIAQRKALAQYLIEKLQKYTGE